MAKKKFFQTDVGKVLKGAVSVLAPNLLPILDGKTDQEAVLKAIHASNEPPEVKLQLEEIALKYEAEITQRHISDNNQGLWLPRLVRPLTLMVLVCVYCIGFFLNYDVSIIHPPLMTVFGFYFGGRSLEKLFNKQ